MGQVWPGWLISYVRSISWSSSDGAQDPGPRWLPSSGWQFVCQPPKEGIVSSTLYSLFHNNSVNYLGTYSSSFIRAYYSCLGMILHRFLFWPLGSWFYLLSHPFFSIKNSYYMLLSSFISLLYLIVVQGPKGHFSFCTVTVQLSTMQQCFQSHNSLKNSVGF